MKLAFEGSHFLLLLLPYFNGSARRFVFAQLLALNGCRAERRCIDVLTLCGILVAVLNFVDDVTAATSFLVPRRHWWCWCWWKGYTVAVWHLNLANCFLARFGCSGR